MVSELDLSGLGDGGMKEALSTRTQSSNGKVAESGNMDMEKQTIQSGWGWGCMKGVSEAPLVLGIHRAAPNNSKSEPNILQSFRREAPAVAVTLGSTQGGFPSFNLHSRHFIHSAASPRNRGPATHYQGLHKS